MAGLSWVQGSGERLERRPLLDPGAGARQRESGPFGRGRGAAQTACIVVDRIKFIIAQQSQNFLHILYDILIKRCAFLLLSVSET